MFNLKAYRKYFNVDTQVSPGWCSWAWLFAG